MTAKVVFVCTAALLASQVSAGKFLEAEPSNWVSTSDVKDMIASTSSESLTSIGDDLLPLFQAMPKNQHGQLDPPVVRYALHRYFAMKYGWYVRGLEPSAAVSDHTSATTVEKHNVPSFIESNFVVWNKGKGLDLRDLTLFVSIMRDLIRQESRTDLEGLYTVMNMSSQQSLQVEGRETLVGKYFVMFLKGVHRQASSMSELVEMEEELVDRCIMWYDANMWLKDLTRTLDWTRSTQTDPFRAAHHFDSVHDAVADVTNHFGDFQNMECQSMKQRLVDMEDPGTGRVPLSKFYGGYDDEDWPFFESTAYLSSLGALDESVTGRPTVIIPNYLSSSSFCVSPSSYYKVCCKDECEGLMAHIEGKILDPHASPDRLLDVVSSLGSDTVEAPRNMSQLQITRLEEIAAHHGGKVPLHGRLFAQWMHHAFPRECRFPHISGTTNPATQEEWVERMNVDSIEASESELRRHSRKREDLKERSEVETELSLPWLQTEELVAPHVSASSNSIGLLQSCAMAAMLISALIPAVRASKSTWSGLGSKASSHLV